MAEQAINTIYLLGDKPDTLCESIMHNFVKKVFAAKPRDSTVSEDVDEASQLPRAASVYPEDGTLDPEPSVRKEPSTAPNSNDIGDSFQLSQLLFLVGHVAIKHLVYLELVERDLKRRKDEAAKDKRTKDAVKGNKDVEELDQVAGNAEDDIGDHIQDVKEREMLYGPQSLLADFGPLIVHICASPKKYKVRFISQMQGRSQAD